MSKRKPARTIKARSASKIRKAAGSRQPKGRANSKQARVLALLCGPSGATITTVTRSTGWQPAGVWIGRLQAHQEADMSLRTTLALAGVIILSTAVTASAAAKKQRVPRSGSQAQAVAPRSAAPFNPYSPSLTGAGSPGYNQSLMTWR